MTQDRIWVIDDDRSIRWVLERALSKAGMDVTTFDSADGVLQRLEQDQPDAIISDIRMPGIDGLDLMGRIHELWPELPIIIMTAYSDLDSAVAAYQGGAFEYLPKPFDTDEAIAQVRRAANQGRERHAGQAATPAVTEDTGIFGEAPAMQEVFRAIGRLARSSITVLITGESGTGKELVAHALHRHSPRAKQPFIAINTAAIPRDLLESELFGHERGAFTGAQANRQGRFEQAAGGSLFLDEIGDMPADLQTRLLRVLSDGEYYRVGGHTPRRADVRIIAATHQDLERLVEDGRFREDLLHRLNVIRIRIPPLRERPEDIPLLTERFLKQAATELGEETKALLPETSAYLRGLSWRGNVRQLENTCRWLTVMASGREIRIEDLPVDLRDTGADVPRTDSGDWREALRQWARERLARGDGPLLDEALPVFEQTVIEAALEQAGGRRQDAARLLGWGRNTLTRKIKELGMDVDGRGTGDEAD